MSSRIDKSMWTKLKKDKLTDNDNQQVKMTPKLANLLCLHFSKAELDKLGRVINSASGYYYLQHELHFYSSSLHN